MALHCNYTLIKDDQVASWNESLRGQDADTIITWSSRTFSDRTAIPVGLNAGGMVLLHKVFEKVLPIPRPHVFTIDTGMLFPETPALIEACNKRYGIEIEVVHPDPEEVEMLTADRSPTFFLDDYELGVQCCDIRKARPYAKIIRERNFAACITGMLSDADRPSLSLVERDFHNRATVKVNPLARWTIKEVWDEIRKYDLPYHPRLNEFPHLACALCTQKNGVRNGRRECGIHGVPKPK